MAAESEVEAEVVAWPGAFTHSRHPQKNGSAVVAGPLAALTAPALSSCLLASVDDGRSLYHRSPSAKNRGTHVDAQAPVAEPAAIGEVVKQPPLVRRPQPRLPSSFLGDERYSEVQGAFLGVCPTPSRATTGSVPRVDRPVDQSPKTPQEFDLTAGDYEADEYDFFPELAAGTTLQGWVQHFDIAIGDGEKSEDGGCSTTNCSQLLSPRSISPRKPTIVA